MSQWSGPQDRGRGPATCVVCEHSYVMCWRGGEVLVEGEGRGGEWSAGGRGGGAGGRGRKGRGGVLVEGEGNGVLVKGEGVLGEGEGRGGEGVLVEGE